jgi:hypothetical protein
MHTAEHCFTSKPEEIRKGNEHNSYRDEQNGVGYEVGKDHQGQAADQWDDSPLFPTVDKKAKPNGAEKQSPKKRRGVQWTEDA